MVTRNLDSARDQGDGGVESNPDVSVEQLHLGAGNTVFKSGPLFISSKGIGWTSWKKRWFILTRTSLVFFRSDPNGLPHKGSEDLTLGGIDLNNSGSVLVRADKKLLTVLFPDGRDGRAFTLKAETSEEMYEWKTALEDALAQAPSAASVMGQNGIFRNDSADTTEGPFEQWRKKRNAESLVIGRPMLLALQEVDGNPSFLEKALRFIEKHGVRVEGILRQSADVDEVEHRVQEYEQGKNEFSPDEDAHVVSDCVKHVLRELPSSPVPASCCTSLLEAYRSSQGHRASALRAAIFETFPDPNLRLLQRILQMMQTVVSHKFENLMSTSAVAACMAPLLLRPLLAGDCDLENDADTGGDGSLQFLQAAAAANHAQAIVITLLEEFDKIFLADGSFSSELYPESEDTGIEDSTEAEFLEDDGYPDAQNDLDPRIVYDHERALNGSLSETSGDRGSKLCSNQFSEGSSADIESHKLSQGVEANTTFSEQIHTLPVQFGNSKSCSDLQSPSEKHCAPPLTDFHDSSSDVTISTSPSIMQTEFSIFHSPLPCITESANKPNEPEPSVRHWPVWSRSSARKNLSLDSIDYHSEDENAIQKLEYTKVDLQNKISKEVKGNAILQASLEERRQALHDHRSALEQDVKRLQEQLERERALRSALEAGLEMPLEQLSVSSTIDGKIRADIEEIALVEADVTNLKNKVADLHLQLDQQKHLNYVSACESCGQHWKTSNQQPAWFAQKSKTVTTGTTHCYERPPRSEDALPGASGEKVISQESLQPFNKQPSNNELPDSARQDSAKSVEAATSLFPGELMTAGPQSASRKVSGKAQTKQAPQMQQSDSVRENGFKTVEAADLSTRDSFAGRPQASSTKTTAKAGGQAPAQSALTKLANRLSLLRERRSHLVSELQVLGTNKVSQGPLLSPSPRTRSR